jgi:hypothetical protein
MSDSIRYVSDITAFYSTGDGADQLDDMAEVIGAVCDLAGLGRLDDQLFYHHGEKSDHQRAIDVVRWWCRDDDRELATELLKWAETRYDLADGT